MKTETLQIIAEVMRNTREQHTFEALKKAVETEESGARAKTGKINFFKFALKPSKYLSDDRKWMTGIVHKDGKRIASDGFIVVMERADYPKDMEGKSIGRKDEEIKRGTPLPEFRYLIPKDADEFPKMPVKADFRTDKDSIVKIGDRYVRGDILSKFLDFCTLLQDDNGRLLRRGLGRRGHAVLPQGRGRRNGSRILTDRPECGENHAVREKRTPAAKQSSK